MVRQEAVEDGCDDVLPQVDRRTQADQPRDVLAAMPDAPFQFVGLGQQAPRAIGQHAPSSVRLSERVVRVSSATP